LAPGNGEDTNTRREPELRNLRQARESGLAADPVKKGGNSLPALQESLGMADGELVLKLLAQTGNATPIAGPDRPVDWNYVASALRGIGSKGELEGLLAAQMVATHSLGMEFLRRSVRQEQSNVGIDLNLNRSLKILRMFATQLERLDHHRGKGGQKMIVEHVHIYKGGQAVVGTVEVRRDKSNVPKRSDEEQN
jgi:hypothetical protein